MTLYDKKGITKDANDPPGLISRCLKRSGTSFKKLFNNIPNLANDSEPKVLYGTKSGAAPMEEVRPEYHDLALILRDEQELELLDGEKPANLRHLQEVVDKIVCQGKEKMTNARSQEEIVMAFTADIYKIKSLL